MRKRWVIGMMFLAGCAHAPPKPGPDELARRLVKHQHLMVSALREIVNEDPNTQCQYLTGDECLQLKQDRQEMMTLMREASKPYDAEAY